MSPHPNLVQTFGVSLDGPSPCIVLEFCGGGSLDSTIFNGATISDVRRKELALKIAYGLLHLHNNNIVHRDLAARNILVRLLFRFNVKYSFFPNLVTFFFHHSSLRKVNRKFPILECHVL